MTHRPNGPWTHRLLTDGIPRGVRRGPALLMPKALRRDGPRADAAIATIWTPNSVYLSHSVDLRGRDLHALARPIRVATERVAKNLDQAEWVMDLLLSVVSEQGSRVRKTTASPLANTSSSVLDARSTAIGGNDRDSYRVPAAPRYTYRTPSRHAAAAASGAAPSVAMFSRMTSRSDGTGRPINRGASTGMPALNGAQTPPSAA
jgi:hypothetical protein